MGTVILRVGPVEEMAQGVNGRAAEVGCPRVGHIRPLGEFCSVNVNVHQVVL